MFRLSCKERYQVPANLQFCDLAQRKIQRYNNWSIKMKEQAA